MGRVDVYMRVEMDRERMGDDGAEKEMRGGMGRGEEYRERRRGELRCVEEWDHPHSRIHDEGSDCGVCRTREWDEEIILE